MTFYSLIVVTVIVNFLFFDVFQCQNSEISTLRESKRIYPLTNEWSINSNVPMTLQDGKISSLNLKLFKLEYLKHNRFALRFKIKLFFPIDHFLIAYIVFFFFS